MILNMSDMMNNISEVNLKVLLLSQKVILLCSFLKFFSSAQVSH